VPVYKEGRQNVRPSSALSASRRLRQQADVQQQQQQQQQTRQPHHEEEEEEEGGDVLAIPDDDGETGGSPKASDGPDLPTITAPLGTLKPAAGGDAKSALLGLARARRVAAEKGIFQKGMSAGPSNATTSGGAPPPPPPGLEPPEWARQAAAKLSTRGGAVGRSVLREKNEIRERMQRLMQRRELTAEEAEGRRAAQVRNQ
jgi:hypothetical protein